MTCADLGTHIAETLNVLDTYIIDTDTRGARGEEEKAALRNGISDIWKAVRALTPIFTLVFFASVYFLSYAIATKPTRCVRRSWTRTRGQKSRPP